MVRATSETVANGFPRSGWHPGCTMWLALLVLAGCSAGGSGEARLRSLAVEPELPPGSLARRSSGRPAEVPQVIRAPRPFRVADLGPSEPARLRSPAAVAAATPAASASRVHAVAAVEPVRAPAELSPAGPGEADRSSVAEIRDMVTGYLHAFNQRDADAVAGHWAADGESLNLDSGERTLGREAVRDVFAELFASTPGATLAIDVQEIRPVRADVAVIDGTACIEADTGSAAASRFSAVVVREHDRWLLQSMREAAASAPTHRPHPLADLAWLVGFWEDEGEGVTAGTRCDWTPGQGFLLRQHSVAPDSRPATLPRTGDERIPRLLQAGPSQPVDVTELIGWDPDRESIRSWIFSSDGRFAEATWQPDGTGWVVLVEGRGADSGREVRCSLLADGPDGYVVECDGDALDGLLPPACGFSRTAR